MRKVTFLGIAALAATPLAAILAQGCTSNGTVVTEDAGPSTSGDSSTPTGDSSTPTGDSSTPPADSGPDAQSTLYGRLGGESGIRTAVNAVVSAELADPDLASYFFNQVATVVPTGHPTEDQLEQCFTIQLASAAGGGQTYPTTVTDDAGSFTCRDMATIHTPLMISGGTFDKFIMIAGATLSSAGVSAADVTTVAGVLTSERPLIVDATLNDAGEQAYPGGDSGTDASDAGSDG